MGAINSRLMPKAERPDPTVLVRNAGLSFQGSVVLGMGFTLTPDERDALVQRNRANAQRIFPYLGGEEVNTSPTQSHDRYVINFGQMSLEEAEHWPDLMRIVRERVEPERRTNNRQNYRERWWRFGEARPGLYAAISPLQRCLVTARVTKHLCFSFQPTNRVLNEKLYVFPFAHHTPFAILQSRIHEAWVRLLSSTLKTDLNYSASDCFETFPFPNPDPRTLFGALEAIGQALYDARAQLMLDTEKGLTKTYNDLKDPACKDARIFALRTQHEALDRAVLDAYGWGNVPVPPFCPTNDAERERLQAFKDDVIDRLFVLNAERAALEGSSAAPSPRGRRRREPAAQTLRGTDASETETPPDAPRPLAKTHPRRAAAATDAAANDTRGPSSSSLDPRRSTPPGKPPPSSRRRKTPISDPPSPKRAARSGRGGSRS
ncbi:MAG: type IIL restriction-modification enzyme MmeI [Deltaproteobacteria bacterium]